MWEIYGIKMNAQFHADPFKEANNEDIGNKSCQRQKAGCLELNVPHRHRPRVIIPNPIAPVEFAWIEIEATFRAGKNGNDEQTKKTKGNGSIRRRKREAISKYSNQDEQCEEKKDLEGNGRENDWAK
jgi:hypothetical protein